jgi:WD40 repeat protein
MRTIFLLTGLGLVLAGSAGRAAGQGKEAGIEPRGSFSLAAGSGTLRLTFGQGELLVGAGNGGLVQWFSLPAGKPARQLDIKQKITVMSAAMTPDGKYLALGGIDNTVRLWQVSNMKDQKELFTIKTKSWPTVVLTADGRTLLYAFNKNVTRVDVESKKETLLAQPEGPVDALAISPNGKLAAWASDTREVTVWDLSTGKKLFTLKGHEETVWAVAFSPDGKSLASGSADHTVKVWDVTNGKEVHTLKDHKNAVGALAFTPDGKMLIAGAGGVRTLAGKDDFKVGEVRFWDPARGKLLSQHDAPAAVWSVACSSTGRWVAASIRDAVLMYEVTAIKK